MEPAREGLVAALDNSERELTKVSSGSAPTQDDALQSEGTGRTTTNKLTHVADAADERPAPHDNVSAASGAAEERHARPPQRVTATSVISISTRNGSETDSEEGAEMQVLPQGATGGGSGKSAGAHGADDTTGDASVNDAVRGGCDPSSVKSGPRGVTEKYVWTVLPGC